MAAMMSVDMATTVLGGGFLNEFDRIWKYSQNGSDDVCGHENTLTANTAQVD